MSNLSETPLSFNIVPEFPKDYIGKFYEFMYHYFLPQNPTRFTDISIGNFSISYSVVSDSGQKILRVQVSGDESINAVITPLIPDVSEKEVSEAKEDVDIAEDTFEDQVRKNSLFFAWREGESVVPEKVSAEQKPLQRLFLETQILLMLAFMAVGLVLWYFIGPLLPIVLLAIQFVFVLYSNKIVARTADWRITQKNPFIHILQYPMSLQDQGSAKLSKEDLVKLKQETYKVTIAEKGELDSQSAQTVFSKYGIDCKKEDFMPRKVDVYELVKKVADKFGYKVPEIIISNTLAPNAAASGPSPSRGIVSITTGAFVQLNDEELESVLGHEFGHLKGRDPLCLYALSAVQYLFYYYVILGLVPADAYFLLPIYLFILLSITYFISKFFEARADIVSAKVIGQPKVLADSLEKIGFQRLLFEREPAGRVMDWLTWDPHPPIYFRIARLRNLGDPSKIKSPFLYSAKDVTKGFLESF